MSGKLAYRPAQGWPSALRPSRPGCQVEWSIGPLRDGSVAHGHWIQRLASRSGGACRRQSLTLPSPPSLHACFRWGQAGR